MTNNLIAASAAVALPILGAIAAELIRIVGSKLLADLNPAIAWLRPYYPAIDAALLELPPELQQRLGKNPVAAIAQELLETKGEFSTEHIVLATRWASQQFDFTVHEKFFPSNADSESARLGKMAVDRLRDRMG